MEGLPDDTKRRYINDFLQGIKELMYEGNYYVVDRLVNRQALIDLGLTVRQRGEEILSLSVENYSSGPIKDKNKPGDYWIFGKKVKGREVYIKMKIAHFKDDEQAIIFSFHPSDRPMKYPLS